MEARRIAFALPLIAAPQREKPVGPETEPLTGMSREIHLQQFQYFRWAKVIPDRRTLDEVQHRIGHQIILVGLCRASRPKFRSGLLAVDCCERRDWEEASQRAGPASPAARVPTGSSDLGDLGVPADGRPHHSKDTSISSPMLPDKGLPT